MHCFLPRLIRQVTETAVLLLVVTSCGPGPLDPRTTGGQLLPDTEGLDYLGGNPFSISPDGRWLLFSKPIIDTAEGAEDLESFTLRQLQTFVLYDVTLLEGTPVGLSAGARELVASGAAVFPDGGCWVDGRVVVHNEFGRYLGIDPTAARPEWQAIESEAFAFREHCPREDKMWREPETVGPFHIAHARGRLVIIVDAHDPRKVFAMHRAPRFPGMKLFIGDVRLSVDGWRLAYTITPHFGSFAGNSRGFVVAFDAPPDHPMVLGSPVHAIRWAPEGSAIYADVVHDGQPGIYRWRLPRHGDEKPLPVATRLEISVMSKE
jgi:hypothetical protein